METPNTNSEAIMSRIDRFSKPMRALIHEYGYVIVRDMADEGYHDPEELAEILWMWRVRRQQQWLDTNYVTPRSADRIADALMDKMAARKAA